MLLSADLARPAGDGIRLEKQQEREGALAYGGLAVVDIVSACREPVMPLKTTPVKPGISASS